MCELLGMSANVPTDIRFSFTGLIKRGGETGPHKDGWGITFYEGKGNRTFKDSKPAYCSRVAEMVKQYPIKSKTVISHIRQANSGGVCLENTHPFERELWGKHWTYAHNGQLKGFEKLPLSYAQPVGDTDSEYAFCWIIGLLHTFYGSKVPTDLVDVFKRIGTYGDTLREMGVFNMLMTDGEYMICYCTTQLYWITRRAPFSRVELVDESYLVNFATETTVTDVVTIVATQPLTKNETWKKMETGEFAIFRFGERVL